MKLAISRILRPLVFVLPLFILGSGNISQSATDQVTLLLEIKPETVMIGGDAQLDLDIHVAPGLHSFVEMFKVKWLEPQGVELGALTIKPIEKFQDPTTGQVRDTIEGAAEGQIPLKFIGSLPPAAFNAKVAVTYQVCSEKTCYLPKVLKFTVPFRIVSGAQIAAATGGTGGDAASDPFGKALAKGRLWAYLFVFVGGFLTSLTPCIFPMIPITISIIGARAAKDKKHRAFALSISYVLGIAFTYSILGVLAATTGAVFGAALSNIYVVGVVALIFFLMGLSMFGLFEIQVPALVRNRFGSKRINPGMPGAFLAGLLAGVVASPCIGPVLVSILTFVAKSAEIFFGFTLLFTFAIGMGLLFIVLGTFSGLLTKLPKSGVWMDRVKAVFGVLFIIMSLYYIYPFAKQKIIAQKAKTGADAALNTKANQLNWSDFTESRIAEAKSMRKPVIVDFSADWCVACHELDKYTYTDPDVINASHGFTLLKVDATHPEGPTEDLLKKYNVVGLPTVLFIDANGKIHTDLTVLGFVQPEAFLIKMKAIKN